MYVLQTFLFNIKKFQNPGVSPDDQTLTKKPEDCTGVEIVVPVYKQRSRETMSSKDPV